ncbi:2'-5' RNA ligase [Salinibacillus kushneri]|uniref:2'-5' RNA ligase n=1 Tax=Salinibacillus kushneri TaxID=237682 RepID=A0A1I0DZ37_9BACI|nr:2'-5' RNA ligase family protein [Salinibacillus kushneri]SET37966.1 2'-5' RNA ligase [Salinibacillus kushneri]
MEDFNKDTYIVLDLPKKIADKVKKIRSEHRYTMSLPAEITVTGSSGIGVLQYKQNPSNVYSTIRDVTSRIKPIKCNFGEVSSFPNTDIFFFTLQDEGPIRELHKELVKSDIKFLENPFPYKPHCTLCNNPSLTDIETQELLSKEISEEFILDTVSVYSLERKSNDVVNVSLLERFKLSGK